MQGNTLRFFPLGIAITALCFLIYICLQQQIRLGANDPQIQLSEDIALSYAKGTAYIPLSYPIQIEKSLSPFVIIFDKSGAVRFTNATLFGKSPVVPKGVLEDAKAHGQNRLTWQPAEYTRIAAVVTYAKEKEEVYVLVGRSLQESEQRITILGYQVFVGWILILGAAYIATKMFTK